MIFRKPIDGDYGEWEVALAARFPLALSEMRWPSAPLHQVQTRALARWGLECPLGWRPLLERLIEQLESYILAEPIERRDAFRIVQTKEKVGHLEVYLASPGTPSMTEAIGRAWEESATLCQVCSAPALLRQDAATWGTTVRCEEHEGWTPFPPDSSGQ